MQTCAMPSTAEQAFCTQEEEEWQEVLAQQDTWQHAAEPSSPQARAQPGNLPAALAIGEEAAAFVSAGNAQGGASAPEADDHAVQAELADALVPAGADQSAAALVSCLLQHVTRRTASWAHYLPEALSVGEISVLHVSIDA